MIQFEAANRIRQINPWIVFPDKSESFFKRFLPVEYVNRNIEETAIVKNRALLITGPRQSGKSTVAWQMLRKFVPDILFLNMEDPLLRLGACDAADLTEHIRQTYPFIKAIFIDEIQHIEEAGLLVKGLADAHLDIPIFVTGSSAFDLKSRTRESLAGRATRKHLLPFGLSELIRHAAPPNPVAERHLYERIVSHQLVFGSYPAVWLAKERDEKIMFLNDLAEALILRDASDLFKIKRLDAFRKLLPLLAGQIGNLIGLSEIASICNADVGTIGSYIEILEESHIIRKLRPFAEGKRREIIGAPKIFFIDNGIRNQLLNNFSSQTDLRTDKGQLLENWVFTEILKALPFQSELKFWRSKSMAEVDFIIEHAGMVFALEVKHSYLREPKLSRSARSFIEAYQPKEFIVLNMMLEHEIILNDSKVKFITPSYLTQRLSEIFKA